MPLRLEKLEGLISYPLFIFNSKNVEKEKRRYRKRKKLFKLKDHLKTLRSIIEDVIKLGKEAFSLRQLHCYAFEPVRKGCSLSIMLRDND